MDEISWSENPSHMSDLSRMSKDEKQITRKDEADRKIIEEAF